MVFVVMVYCCFTHMNGEYDEKSSTVGVPYFQTQTQPQLFRQPRVTLGPAALETARVSRESTNPSENY